MNRKIASVGPPLCSQSSHFIGSPSNYLEISGIGLSQASSESHLMELDTVALLQPAIPKDSNDSIEFTGHLSERSSSTISFSSTSSDDSDSHYDSTNAYQCSVPSKDIVSSSFESRLKFWKDIDKPIATQTDTIELECYNNPPSNILRLKRSSYSAFSTDERHILLYQDSNFNNSLLNDSNLTNVISDISSKSQALDTSQCGLYVANSMREAKMQSPIDSLLVRMVDMFNSPVKDFIDPDIVTPYSFFLFYKWTGTTPDVLACKLRLLFSYQLSYNSEGKLKPLAQLLLATPKQKLLVTHSFRYWMRFFPEDFPPNSLILDVMHSLKVAMKKENMTELMNLLEFQYFDTYCYDRKLSLVIKSNAPENNGWLHCDKEPESFEILRLPPIELAKIIIWMEYSLFLQIPFCEFRHYTRVQNSSETPHIYESIKEANSVALWVKSSILSADAPDERALIIETFIDVARETRKLHAYQPLMSLIGALNSGCICQIRLTLTWSLIPKEKIGALHELSKLLAVNNNYCLYRNELEHVKKHEKNFYFPILGVLFKDLIQLDSKSNTVFTGERMEISEYKLLLISKTIETWRKSQNSNIPKSPNFGHVDLVKAAIQLCSIIDEDDLYNKSLIHEPALMQTDAVSGDEMFSQFILNFDKKKIDPSVVKMHVQAMTNAIFSAHDKNHKGHLTENEFLSVQKNIPFIPNFDQLDKNKDGYICQEELYVFLFTSLGNVRDYFTHDFKEFHEFHPAVCSHCRSIMWCPIESASKCRNCDVICHKYCRQKLVSECKPNALASNRHRAPRTKHGKKFTRKSSDRIRHHSATELTETCLIKSICSASKANAADGEITSLSSSDKELFSQTNKIYDDQIVALRSENRLLKEKLNSSSTVISHLRTENSSLQSQMEILKSQLNSITRDFQLNNFELQRQFSNVRDATGEFLLRNFALINSQSYL